jgi:asparagine synthetase B (glutamine-hydrolysing)
VIAQPVRPFPMTELERATGFPIGNERTGVPIATESARDPREALEVAMLRVLRRGRTYVSFSGGRDSSSILATAALLARREGLEEPIALTLRFPGVASTDESAWQERVIEHLGLERWEIIELTDELDLLGEIAQEVLRSHGPLWPFNTHFHVPMFQRASGASLMTGFDGDGLLGGWRWARAQAVLCRRVRPIPRDAARVALALAPRWARRRLVRAPLSHGVTWLTGEGERQLAAYARQQEADQPRRWDRWLRTCYGYRRFVLLPIRSLATVASDHQVRVEHPFLDPGFLAALAIAGGGAGFGSRTEIMRRLFAGVLPDDLNSRPSKAEFGASFWGPKARAFADSWDGAGLDTDLVDDDRLREVWRTPSPLFGSSMLLQIIWLQAQRQSPASKA